MSRRRGLEELERPAQVGFERVRKKRPEESRLVARGAVTAAPAHRAQDTQSRILFRRAHTHTHALTALRLHPRTDMTPQWLRLLIFFPPLYAVQRRPVDVSATARHSQGSLVSFRVLEDSGAEGRDLGITGNLHDTRA